VCHLPYCFWHLHSLITAPGIQALLCETCLGQTDQASQGISLSDISQSDIPPPWKEQAGADEANPLLYFDLSLNWEERADADESNPHR